MAGSAAVKIDITVSGLGTDKSGVLSFTDSQAPTETYSGYQVLTSSIQPVNIGDVAVADLTGIYIRAVVSDVYVSPTVSDFQDGIADITALYIPEGTAQFLRAQSNSTTCVFWARGNATAAAIDIVAYGILT